MHRACMRLVLSSAIHYSLRSKHDNISKHPETAVDLVKLRDGRSIHLPLYLSLLCHDTIFLKS